MNLATVLKTPKGFQIQEAIERKATSPVFERLGDPDKALEYIQTNLCMAYLFARHTIPSFASHVFAKLTQIGPVDDEMGPVLKGIMGLVEGELFNNNIFERPGECHSHYFDIVEAFRSADGRMDLVDSFMEAEQHTPSLAAIATEPLWNKWSVRHATSAMECYPDPLAMFIMIPATEELSPLICGQALKHLCKDSKFDAYRVFLRKHVELDNDDHGPMALKWLDYYIKATGQTVGQIEESASKVLYMMTGKR